MTALLLEVFGAYVRIGLVALSTYLVQRHALTSDQADRLSTELAKHVMLVAPGLLALAWTTIAKYRGRVKLLTALDAPAGTPEAEVKKVISNGLGTPIAQAVLLMACVLGLSSTASAQPLAIDRLTPPAESEVAQQMARGVSWLGLGGAVGMKTWEAWKAPDRKKALLQEAGGLAATGLTSLGVKSLVARDRPCEAAGCGQEDPHKSFWSGHVANACFSIPTESGKGAFVVGAAVAVLVAIGRIIGDRHFLSDTIAGCAGGFAWSYVAKHIG